MCNKGLQCCRQCRLVVDICHSKLPGPPAPLWPQSVSSVSALEQESLLAPEALFCSRPCTLAPTREAARSKECRTTSYPRLVML